MKWRFRPLNPRWLCSPRWTVKKSFVCFCIKKLKSLAAARSKLKNKGFSQNDPLNASQARACSYYLYVSMLPWVYARVCPHTKWAYLSVPIQKHQSQPGDIAEVRDSTHRADVDDQFEYWQCRLLQHPPVMYVVQAVASSTPKEGDKKKESSRNE